MVEKAQNKNSRYPKKIIRTDTHEIVTGKFNLIVHVVRIRFATMVTSRLQGEMSSKKGMKIQIYWKWKTIGNGEL